MSATVYHKPIAGVTNNIQMFESVSWIRARNTIGNLNIVLPSAMYDTSIFKTDDIFELWRTVGNITYLEGDTLWFLRDTEKTFGTKNRGNTCTLIAYDALELLKRRIIAYYANTVYTDKINFVDDMMKNVVRENFGSASIDANRNISNLLSVSPNSSGGVILEKEIAWQNVLDSLQDMADSAEASGQRVLFDIVYDGGALQFRTYIDLRGNDLTNRHILSVDSGNLTDVVVRNNRFDEANYIYALGDATGDIRPYTIVKNDSLINESVYNLREFADTAGDSVDEELLGDAGNRILYENRPRVIYEGNIVNTLQFTYGIDYNYGDKLTIYVDGQYRDVYVDTVSGNVDSANGEMIDIILQAEY